MTDTERILCERADAVLEGRLALAEAEALELGASLLDNIACCIPESVTKRQLIEMAATCGKQLRRRAEQRRAFAEAQIGAKR